MTDDLISRAAALDLFDANENVPTQSVRSLIRALPAVAASQASDPAVSAGDFLDAVVSKAPEPLKQLGKWLSSLLDEDDWPTAERYLNAAAVAVEPQPDPRDAVIAGLETILNERGAVFDAMVDAAEDAAGKDVSFNVVIGRSLRAALAAAKGGAA